VLDSEEEKLDRASVYKEIATCYNKMKDFPKAGEAFQKYIDLTGVDYVESGAFFQLGMAYYQAGNALRSDSSETGKALLTEYITKSDSAFAITCRLSPESYVGYMWRGNVNVLLDPESTAGLAKPHYEAAVDVILKKVQDEGSMSNGYKKQLITAYNYLGYYYYLKEDKANSILYWNKVLELDPANNNAKMVLDAYKAEEADARKK
jgi:tetratricopeptide (TPR) repeat protein